MAHCWFEVGDADGIVVGHTRMPIIGSAVLLYFCVDVGHIYIHMYALIACIMVTCCYFLFEQMLSPTPPFFFLFW